MKKFILILLITTSVASCGIKVRKAAIPGLEVTTTALEELSRLADELQAKGQFTSFQRQNFARFVMVPSIRAVERIRLCIADGDCSNIASHITVLSQALLTGINNFAALLPNGELKTDLINKLNNMIADVNKLHIKFGKQDEEESSEISFSLLEA